MDLSALPASGRVLSGGVCLFTTVWTDLRIFDRLAAAGLLPARLPPLGSVGLCAVELARRLCRGTILTGGIDFSFTMDSYHARSTPGHQDKLRRHSRLNSLLNAAAAFGPAACAAVSKSGAAVRSDPAMRGYRDLFERELGGDERLFDLTGSGLPLGLSTLSPEAACNALAKGGTATPARPLSHARIDGDRAVQLETFLEGEKKRLTRLRDMLTGKTAADAEALDTLIGDCDYLWSHFPDYAGAGDRRPGARELAAASPAAISFLKRLRTEIDPALALLAETQKRALHDD
jgi:hypothetical protein